MDQKHLIFLKEWSPDTWKSEPTGQELSIHSLARSMTLENYAALLDNFLNLGGKGFTEGQNIGLKLCFTHRTLQRLVVCFNLGMIAGLSDQEHTDARNETAIKTAKKMAQMLEAGELPTGFYL